MKGLLFPLAVTCHVLFLFAQLSGIGTDCPPACNYTHSQPGSGQGLLRGSIEERAFLSKTNTLPEAVERSLLCPPPEEADSTPFCQLLEEGSFSKSQDVWQLSYVSSITHLYEQRGGEVAAVCIAAFSFAWPHLKLFLTQILIALSLKRNKPKRRTRLLRRTNKWITHLGHWSIMDIVLMTFVVAIGNLDVVAKDVYASDVKPLLRQACYASHPRKECDSFLSLLSPLVPPVGVEAKVHIKSLFGMEAFCISVVLSTFLGVLLDLTLLWDEDVEAGEEEEAAEMESAPQPLLLPTPLLYHQHSDQTPSSSLSSSAAEERTNDSPPTTPSSHSLFPTLKHGVALSFAVYSALLLLHFLSLTRPSLTLSLQGTAGNLSHIPPQTMSVVDVANSATRSGLLNSLLSVTFWTFLVIVPVTKTCILLWSTALPPTHSSSVSTFARHVGSFASTDVLLLVLPLFQYTLGPITRAMLPPTTTPVCNLHPERDCLSIEAKVHWYTYSLLVLTAIVEWWIFSSRS